MPTLQIVIASTRPGRAGLPVAEWFARRAGEHGGFDLDVVDLAELALPYMNEPHHPRLRRYEHAHTREWSARVEAADAFAWVVPEYNHGYTAPLKNAIDFLHHEWRHKPVAMVSYGGVAAGTRAAEMLKQVAVALHMVPTVAAVSVPFVAQFLDEERTTFTPNDVLEQGAQDVLDELVRLDGALRPLRTAVESAA